MAGEPLPSRILIPVANPLTAEELIRIGASLLDPRTGELTALGIVEVPEGMPLSEGATRARQARRLLQKVLDYAPEGTVIHPLVRIGRHAAAGIVEAAAEQEADLMIFGWGGKSGPHRDAGTPGHLAHDRRGRPRLAVRHRRHQAARGQGHPPDPRPGPRRPPRGARAAGRGRARPPPRGDGRRDAPRAGRGDRGRPGPGRARPRRLRAPARDGALGADPARGPQRPDRDPARGRARGPRRHGRVGAARRRGLVAVRGAAGGDRPAGEADGHRRQDAGPDHPGDVRAARPEGRDPRRGGPAGRGVARDPGQGRSLVRGGELPPLRVQRPRAAHRAQGEAGPDGLARPADAQRVRDDRARSCGAPSARCRSATRCSTRSSSSTPIPPTTPATIAEEEGARVVSAPRRARAVRLVPGQGRGALEVALRDVRRHRRVGGHGRAQLAPPHGLRDARAAARRAAAAVRQGLLPAPDRRGRASSRRAAAGASRSSSRGR